MSPNTNERTDEYGKSIENRLRFLNEVLDEVIFAIGHDRTGIRFSLNGESEGVEDAESLYAAAAKLLSAKL